LVQFVKFTFKFNRCYFIVLIFSLPSLAGKETQISEYRAQVISYSLEEISKETIKLDGPPKFENFNEVSKELYTNVKTLGDGQDSKTYRAISTIDRPDIGLKQGDALVVRAARITTNQEQSSEQMTLINFARLERLRNIEAPITHFFPSFYGAYLAVGETKYFGRQELSHVEMEGADDTFANEFNCGRNSNWQRPKKQISDCQVFEFCLGEWAGAYFAGVGSFDAKPDNWAVKKSDYKRTYIIEGKSYVVPASEAMPKRIDVGGAGNSPKADKPRLKNSYSCSLSAYAVSAGSAGCKVSSKAEEFLRKLYTKREESIFSVFEQFYNESTCKTAAESDTTEKNVTFSWPVIE
jgi:hypothetical protein